MSLPYGLRLLCLCCASFFMIHLALAVAARLSAGTAVRMAERLKPSSAARLLFAVRMLPWTLTLFAVLAFCIPSYLWLEPEATGEKVGFVCFLTALLGAAIWALAIVRVVSAVRGTARYLHRCERHGEKITMPGETGPALLLKDRSPVLAVAGVVHPRLVISRRVMRGLTTEQIDAALSHERAHRSSGDNLKRFLMLLAPDVLPFMRGFVTLERSWAKAIEWAERHVPSAIKKILLKTPLAGYEKDFPEGVLAIEPERNDCTIVLNLGPLGELKRSVKAPVPLVDPEQ